MEFENAVEGWALYDTILVCKGLGNKAPGWFNSYAEVSQRNKLPFFNVRNQGETSLAYNNLETKDQMPYAFSLMSIGVSFEAPAQSEHVTASDPEAPAGPRLGNASEDILFVKEIPRHVGLRLRVRQDDKLLHTVQLAPEGAGIYGVLQGAGGSGTITGATNGMPQLGNRWTFPTPIGIPRGATYSVELELSEYARTVLGAMCGPTKWTWDCDGAGTDLVEVPACASIRVSMVGVREVQQRNALHFG